MIRHLLKIIWAQRKTNGWIFAELAIVVGAVWYMIDNLYVDTYTYYSPMGLDIDNVWQFKLDNLSESAPGYVPEEQRTTDEAADLHQLEEHIRRHPKVESLCVAYYSAPYSWGNSWRGIQPIDGDTTLSSKQSFQMRRVTPDYFTVFRIKDTEGKPITPQVTGVHQPLVISAEMERVFFPGQKAKGKKVTFGEEQEYPITAVCASVRSNEFEKPEPFFYQCLEGAGYNECVLSMGAASAELCVRMQEKLSIPEMNKLLEEMGESLTVNNLYVYSARPITEQRGEALKAKQDEMKIQTSMMAFVLLNVLFGIIGTFWLRTQSRRGEIGLRIALGADKPLLKRYLYIEGLCLLALTLPLTIFFAVNSIYFDLLDSNRLPLSIGRFLLTFGGTYLLIGGMILAGISLPARKATQMEPAEALHYE
ncbi:FtsX-like permease family protein [Parabacteroides sp. Marseille-P3160]|uniref:FtsX-like permease family protein n=1 Tax=Parabacteroides sp. Marseille-P3160 TaxID=1917887 RepID=UPI0009BB5BDF|nr:FtsX-like permease family protein [Parabacteroides sp. Marseille-P3160]